MNAAEVQSFAQQLLREHGLSGWRFCFDNARNRLGSCDYRRQVITLSRHLCGQGQQVVAETLLHEVAHALVGPGHGHDAVWQAQAIALGVPPQATSDERVLPRPRWQLVCDGCQQVLAERHRRRLNLAYTACAKCGPDRGTLSWHDVGLNSAGGS